jgi:asparagine synthase (glutamine-hydrolysing)
MAPRGPDAHGEWADGERGLWLGHRRLSIIDLSERGRQPMLSHDGKLVVTFNGEIYNYAELRAGLVARGHRFLSSSDTEVLLELYRAEGVDGLKRLRGMYAFALWDRERHRLLLARDPYGIKPLYYADHAGTITFASSVKAIARHLRQLSTPDAAAAAGFFVFGSVPEPWTTFTGICALPAGTVMVVDGRGTAAPRSFLSIARIIAEAEASAADLPTGEEELGALRVAFADSVRQHLVADVPVGAFLSAGVDSGAMVGLMRDAGQSEIRTLTLGYEEFEGQGSDEVPLAQTVARHYGTDHVARRVGPEEFLSDLPRIFEAMDQPSIDGVNTWFVSKAAHELGLKVAISGIGGDELLGGYSTFQRAPQLMRWAALPARIPGFGRLVEHAVASVRGAGLGLNPKYSGLVRYGGTLPGAYLLVRGLFLPSEFDDLRREQDFLAEGLEALDPQMVVARCLENGPVTSFGKMAVLESCLYLRNQLLRDTDWASMAHSLEVRTPLVDHVLLGRVVGYLMRRNDLQGKRMLAYAPSRPLPNEVIVRRKSGFGIPIERWLGETIASEPSDGTASEINFSRRWARYVSRTQNFDAARSSKRGLGMVREALSTP